MNKNYVKTVRTLLESEIEQAEVIIAAKGFAQELQNMIEKVGRLMNEDLGPVVDQMREAYGNEVSANFGEMMGSQMQEVIDELRISKDKIDDSVDAIASGQMPSNDVDMDADLDMGGDDLDLDAELELGDDDMDGDLEADLDMDAELELDDEPQLGRETKESKIEELRNKMRMMEDKIAKAKA
jgi:hypothetical protein